MERNRGLLVEFVGLPAAGKTTVASALERSVTETLTTGADDGEPRVTTSTGKRDGIRLSAIAKLVAMQFLAAPARSVRSLVHLVRSGQKSVTKLPRYYLYQLYVCEELRRAIDEDEIHLADQGFLQHLWRVHLTSTREGTEAIGRLLLDQYPALEPDVVVFVTVDHRTRMDRGNERGTPVDDELYDPNHPAIQADRDAYRELQELVSRLADEEGREIRTIEIDNEAELLEANTAKMTTLICDELASQV